MNIKYFPSFNSNNSLISTKNVYFNVTFLYHETETYLKASLSTVKAGNK